MNSNTTKNLEKIKNSIWSFFIRRRPITYLVIIAIIIFGALSAYTMPKELQPEIVIPYGTVSTVLPGASPDDVESLLTIPLEKEIASVNNIKSLNSSSNFNSSVIFIEFETNTDLDAAIQDVKEATDRVTAELPEDATDPMVQKAEANSFSIISFTFASERPLNEITEIAEKSAEEMENINGVSRVDVFGGQEKYIKVALNQKKVEAYGVDINTIANLIKFGNSSSPVGLIDIDKLNYSVRIDNQYKSINDIKNLPLFSIENMPILLKDIAIIEETYKEKNTISRFSNQGKQPQESLSISVNKKDGANILNVADDSRAKIEELKKNGLIPSDITVEVSNDNSDFIRRDLGVLTTNGIQTTIIITIVLFLALGLKEGLLAGLAIPLSFLIAFTVMNFLGLSINSLSLFSLVIALGLMVDTAIIVMEGIFENMNNGSSPKESALISLDTYKWPLIAGTMTTVFAFFPMLLVSGIIGEFLKTLPITISATLIGSLIVSLTIIPAIASKVLKPKTHKKHQSILEPLFKKLGKFYYALIKGIINRKFFRSGILFVSLVLFALSTMLPATGILKTELFPKTDAQYFFINIETPTGTILEETEKVTKKVEEHIFNIPEVKNFLTVIGQSSMSMDLVNTGPNINSNIASITVNLKAEKERERRSYEIAKSLREKLNNFRFADISITEITEGPPTDAAVTVRITGEDLNQLKEISNHIRGELESIDHTENVRDNISAGLNEFIYTLNKEKLAIHDISAGQVANTIRNIVQGTNADEIHINNEDINIFVEYDQDFSITDIENFEILSQKGYSVNLSQLGTYKMNQSVSGIQREDQKRIIKVFSDLDKEGNPVAITEELQNKLKNYKIPDGYQISYGGDLQEIEESFMELYESMAVGIILIAFCLVLMFNSFKQPFIIILALPLALIGVFPGLTIIGQNLSFPAFLGVVALTGIVVNDAIVLIDRININRKEGIPFKEAIAEASNSRLQPIIMTSITTIIGILPLALTNEFWSGLGFSLIFGLSFSTILTLIVIPVIYHAFEARADRKKLLKKQAS